MKVLRTPDERFQNLPGYPFEPHYTEVPDGDGGTLRIHHIDEGPAGAPIVLCMHGQPTWSYLYRRMIPILTGAGLRVLAPDLVGFGRSDKPAAREDYTYQRQVDWLTAWLEKNGVRGATLVGQDWGGLIGLRLVAENPDRFDRVVAANTALPLPMDIPQERIDAVKAFMRDAPTPTMPEVFQALRKIGEGTPERAFAYWQKWTWETEDLPIGFAIAGSIGNLAPDEIAAYEAPFPDPSYQMGPRAMPRQVPMLPDDPSVPANRAAWAVLAKWTKPFLCAFTADDPVTSGGGAHMAAAIPGAKGQPHVTFPDGGHFLQERRGADLAKVVADFVKST